MRKTYIAIFAASLAPLCASAQSVSALLTATPDSDVQIVVGGNLASGTFSPGFFGDVSTSLTFSGGVLTDLDVTGGSFTIPDQIYDTVGAVTQVTGSGLTFDANPSFLSATSSAVADRYNLSGILNLTMSGGSLNFGGLFTYDFAAPGNAREIQATLDSAESFIDIVGDTNVGLAVLKFPSQQVFSETVGPLSATLNVASLDTIQLTAVPEPAASALLFSGLVATFVALRRKRA